MEIIELRQQIIDKDLKHLYIFTGDEIKVKNIYIDQINSIVNLPIVYTDSFAKIKNRIFTKSFLSQDSVYIVINDKNFIADEKNFKDLLTPVNDYILFIYDSIDKRSKFYKEFSNSVVEFDYLDEETLVKYIQKDFPKLIENNCKELIKKCNNNYSRICYELDKIKTYNDFKYKDDSMINSSFYEVIKYIYDEPKDVIFNLIDQILMKNRKEAFKLLEYCEAGGESNINIIYNLYNNTRQLYQVQYALNSKAKDLEKTTGLKPFIIKMTKKKCNIYSDKQLTSIMRLLQEIDTNIKKGLMDEEISVRYAMNKIFSLK